MTIVGAAESGDKQEMSVRFVDGQVDDWATDEFQVPESQRSAFLPLKAKTAPKTAPQSPREIGLLPSGLYDVVSDEEIENFTAGESDEDDGPGKMESEDVREKKEDRGAPEQGCRDRNRCG